MAKPFAAILRQLLLRDDADVMEYVTRGLEKYNGDPFLTAIFGAADTAATDAFISFLRDYRQQHPQNHTNCALAEVV